MSFFDEEFFCLDAVSKLLLSLYALVMLSIS